MDGWDGWVADGRSAVDGWIDIISWIDCIANYGIPPPPLIRWLLRSRRYTCTVEEEMSFS